jgi:hypothetical protein
MKKIISISLAIAIAMSMTFSTAASTIRDRSLIPASMRFTEMSDALDILRYIIGLPTETVVCIQTHDLNADGVVDVADALMVLQGEIGLLDFIPVIMDENYTPPSFISITTGAPSRMPMEVFADGNTGFRDAIINEVSVARSGSADVRHASHKVDEITEFYFPHVEIRGYELRSVGILEGVMFFNYAPIGVDSISARLKDDVISVHVRCAERFDPSVEDHFRTESEYRISRGYGYLTESGMVYDREQGNIIARLGNTSIRIDVPQHMNSYETLRDLALQVIESAELVRV